MLVSLQIISYCSAPLPSSSFYSSNYIDECRAAAAPPRITCCSSRLSAETLTFKSPPPPPPPPKIITTDEQELEHDEDKRTNPGSGVEVPRQRYISVSKSDLLDAIISTMFPASQEKEEARQFLSLSQCLDSILHVEHKTILEEMRADFDLTRKRVSHDDFQESDVLTNNSMKSDSIEKKVEDEKDPAIRMSSDFKLLLDFTLNSAKTNPIKTSSIPIPSRFQRAFMKLLYSAEFEELSPRDLLLTSALNTDYLLTLPIYVDWKKASESSVVIFRRGYATERQKGLLIAEKLDYLQSKLLQNFFLLIAKPLGAFGVWLNEVFRSITKKQDTEVLANKFKLWLKELSVSLKPHSFEEQMCGDIQDVDILSSDFPIWEAAQRAVTHYEGILSEVGPRERLLRRFLAWIGLLPSNPKQAFNLDSDSTGSESILSPNFLSRISLSDIWKPASPKSCGNDLTKILRAAISILFSQSILQEPTFQELILLYTKEIGEEETTNQAEVPSLQMKIYERIPIPDLPVVFPHKKLSFRILDTVRLDVATILGLLAYFFSYKFEDILSSPFAIFLDVIPASALVIYVTRVVLGYKQTRDRYQLLVNKTLYEKTIASGFGAIHFLIDASEQQQYKEAILVYATLLKQENGQVTSIRAIEDKCETFLYNNFQEKVKMPVSKAIETLARLGLVVYRVVDEQTVLQAMPCNKAYIILRDRWNSLIN